jgi:periplasmic divalent cation tolerance protein
MIIKTKKDLFDDLVAEVKKLHSYDVPEIIAIPISLGSEDYITWLRESTGK